MSFKITNFNKSMLSEIIKIWNEDVASKKYLTMYTKERFEKEILNNKNFKEEGFKLIFKEKQLIAFGLAIFNKENKSDIGYISFVVVKKEFQRMGYGTKILNELCKYLKNNNKLYIRQMFLDPIKLKWNIMGTKNHIHPNTPAILYNSPFYLFLINNKFYIDGDNQNAYYLNLKDFKLSETFKKNEKINLNNGYKIEKYNKRKHFGEEELFKDLNNLNWYEVFKENVENDKHPMLVVVKNNKIEGWTGPIYTKEDKRGYFAGIGISSNARNKGLGTLLFNKLIIELKNIGAEYMSLFTGENNKARYIYERTGFKLVNSFAILKRSL